jgi:hypothetical protein
LNFKSELSSAGCRQQENIENALAQITLMAQITRSYGNKKSAKSDKI